MWASKMHDVTAIIHAAGRSRHMDVPKQLLLPMGQRNIIRHGVMQFRADINGPITVVTGHGAAPGAPPDFTPMSTP